MPRSGVYRLAQAKGDSEFSQVKKELGSMKEGELRHIRVGKGPQGLISVRKKAPVDPAMGIMPKTPRTKSRVIPLGSTRG